MDLVTLKRFDTPDETRVLVKGKFEVIHVGGMTIGRATVSYTHLRAHETDS